MLEAARAVAANLKVPFRQVVNEALRAGLRTVEQPPPSRPYCTHPHKMGLKAGKNLDNIQTLLSEIEGEGHQ